MDFEKPVISPDSPIMPINCEEEFIQLTNQEKLYAYYFYKAAWEGSKICFFQRSFESPALFLILQLTFSQSLEKLKHKCLANGLTEKDWTNILVYCAAFFNNCGNYRSFGDDKFVPDVLQEVFHMRDPKLIDLLWEHIHVEIFEYSDFYKKIGFPSEDGLSGYYSANMTMDDIEDIDELLGILNISPLNTRIAKTDIDEFAVLVASCNLEPPKTHNYKDKKIKIYKGDFGSFLRRVSYNLIKALFFCSNNTQKNMIKKYITHFNNGDIESHKDSQRFWVNDKNPVVETNIGFIETYLDPRQTRAEFEGFVAIVNKNLSERMQNLVTQGMNFIKKLPWPSEYEKDTFLKPEFNSLSVIGFAGSGIPLGINIPNYDDIRQEEGFKNVYLSNCIMTMDKALFLSPDDNDILIKYQKEVYIQKVSYHELLGHGCGKLFIETDTGLNFDEKTKNPITGAPVDSYYKGAENYNSKFGSIANSYEECRADAIALYFSTFKEGTEILLPDSGNSFLDICYASWLEAVLSGVRALEHYMPNFNKWGQAHLRGRFVILQVLLEAKNNFIDISLKKKEDGTNEISINVDKSQIMTTGYEALKAFLLKMQVYKSIGDVESATEIKIVMENKKPRRIELQGVMEMIGNEVFYKTFAPTWEGVIESYMHRFPYFDQEVFELWNEFKDYFKKPDPYVISGVMKLQKSTSILK